MNCKSCFIFGAVLAVLVCGLLTAPAAAQTKGMVVDNVTGMVVVFDADTNTVLGSVGPIGGFARGDCAIKADQTIGFATNFINQVWAINLTTSPPLLAPAPNPIPIVNLGEDLSFSPDESFLLACDGGLVQPISVIHVATRTEVSTFSLGHDCNSVDVCKDGSVLVTSIITGNVRRLTLSGSGILTDTGEVLFSGGSGFPSGPNNVTCAPDGNSAVVVRRDPRQIRSFLIPGLTLVDTRALSGTSPTGISAAFTPTGTELFARSNGGAVDRFSYNPATASLSASPALIIPISSTLAFTGMEQMAVHPDGTKLYVSQPGAVKVYDVSSGALLATITHPDIVSPTGICFPGGASNVPPAVAANSASVTVNEGTTAANSGSFSDPNSADTVAVTANVGTVTQSGTNSGTWSWSLATSDGPAESQTVTITAADSNGATATTTFSLTVNNVAPAVSFNLSANPINENDSITLSATISDPGTLDSHTAVIDWGDGSPTTGLSLAAGVLTFSASHQYLDDNPTATPSDNYPITATVTDKDGASGSAGTSLTVNNLAPVVGAVTGPASPLALGSSATVSANFTDVGTQDTHTCSISWDDGTTGVGTVTEGGGSGSCAASRTYAAAGVYTVTMTITDDDTGTASSLFQRIVVFDPNGAFVTGDGWMNSPPGAYAPDPTLTGKVTFSFVSKYLPGRTMPSGNTEFQFNAAGLNFKSTAYDWLVVAGYKAQYKGVGTINGVSGFRFLLTAYDGDAPGGGGEDKFRIKIVEISTGAVVYDNVMGASEDMDAAGPQPIAGGSIVIHKD